MNKPKPASKPKQFMVPMDPYDRGVYVQLGGDVKEAFDWWREEEDPDSEIIGPFSMFQGGICAGSTYTDKGVRSCVIWIRDRKPDVRVVVHEALHAVADIMRDAGIYFTESSEEAYAYLLDYLVGEIWGQI